MRNLVKTGTLLRFNLRADWAKIAIWLICIAGLVLAVGFKFDSIYGSDSALATIKVTLNSASMVALLGAFDLPTQPTVAQVFGSEMLIFTSFVVIAMNFALGIAKTRGEEDRGMTEMLRARAIGRQSALASAAFELLIVNGLMTLILGGGLMLADIPGASVAGDWALSLGLGLNGLAFGMVGLLVAQLANNHSSATIFAYMLFLAAYIVRMMTDVANPDYSWWSPLGWLEKTQPYIDNNWWALLPMIVLAGASWLLAVGLVSRRDLGSGLIATHPGKRRASAFLGSPLALIWRLNRTMIICWLIGSAVLGATYGSIFSSIGDVMKSNPTIQTVFGSAAVHSANHMVILNYTAIILLVIAALATIPAIQLATSLKRDERRGWLELMYAHQVSRTNIYFSGVMTAISVGLLTFWAGACGLILTGNATLSHVAERVGQPEFWHAMVVGIPIVVLLTAVALLLTGLLPKLTVLAWLVLGYGFLSVYMGALLKLPDWAKQLTPFDWQPKVPVSQLDWGAFWLTLGAAVILIVVGWIGYQKRDLQVD